MSSVDGVMADTTSLTLTAPELESAGTTLTSTEFTRDY